MLGYVTAAIRGDEFAHLAMELNKAIADYPEPVTIEEALGTPDAEQWSQAINEEFGSMKRCDLLSDPVSLPTNGRVVGTKWVFKRKRNL